MKSNIVIYFLLLLSVPVICQEGPSDLDFEIKVIHTPMSIPRTVLDTADRLKHINPYYDEDWVKEYSYVDIVTIHSGQMRIARSKDDRLTEEQLTNLRTADTNTKIEVSVKYLPDNKLADNELKDRNFSISIRPDHDAIFHGSEEALLQYVKKHMVSLMDKELFTGYTIAAVRFVVNEFGQIVDARIAWPYESTESDTILLRAVCDMPDWTPATYQDGTKVRQEKVVIIGNLENCAINTFFEPF